MAQGKDLGALIGQIGADITEWEKAFKKMEKDLDDLDNKGRRATDRIADSFDKVGKKMTSVGSTMTKRITLPLAAVATATVKAAGDFEDSFADIRKTVDASEGQFTRIADEMRDMAGTMPTSVNELNRMAGVAGQLGVEAENIAEFTEVIAKLGDTTDIAGEQAALSLSRFMNIMGTAQGDIDKLGSTIVGLGNNFAAMESEIIDISTSMAPLGNAIGLTEQNVLAFGAAIAASGGEAQAASTAFQKAANTMKRAVLEGTKDLEIFARTAGMSAQEFQEEFEQNAFQALIKFMEGLRQVQQEGGSMAAVLDEIGLADQRLIREFGKVVGNLDQVRQAAGLANDEWERNTALTEEAEKRYETFNSRIGILWNQVYDLAILYGNSLMPVVDKLIKGAETLIELFSEMNEGTRTTIAVMAGLVAATGPVVWVLGSMATKMGAIIRAWPKVKAALAGMKAGITGVSTAANLSVGALGGFIAAMSVLGYVSYQANKRSDERIKALENEAKALETVAEANEKLVEVERKIADMQRQMSRGAGGAGLQRKLEDLLQLRDDIIDQRNLLSREELNNMSTYNDELTEAVENMAEFQRFLNMDFSGGGGGRGRGSGASAAPSIPTAELIERVDNTELENPFTPIPQSDVQDEIDRVQRIMNSWEKMDVAAEESTEKAKIMGDALQTSVTNAIVGFAETIGDAFTGDAGASGFFNNILMIVADFGKQLGKMLVAAGIAAQAFQTLLTNPVGAILAGGALIAAATAAKNLLKEGPAKKVDDALITSRGDVVEFHPDDDILAMKDFSALGSSGGFGGGGRVPAVESHLYIDGRELEIALEDREYDRTR